jgi:hypothetical protein
MKFVKMEHVMREMMDGVEVVVDVISRYVGVRGEVSS